MGCPSPHATTSCSQATSEATRPADDGPMTHAIRAGLTGPSLDFEQPTSAGSGTGGDVVTPRLLLTIREVGRALGIGRSSTYELIAAGELEVVHIGRSARVPVASVEAFVERLRHRPVVR